MYSSVCVCPVRSAVALSLVVGFSGSRLSPPPAVANAIELAVAGLCGQSVSVGCARGVDELVRGLCPDAVVFRAADFGRGRGSFAARSVACVRSVAVERGLWVSFPASPCPAGLVPSSSSSRAFCGAGSGTWASLAFAAGLGVRCLVFLPDGVLAPSWLAPLPGAPLGWFELAPVPVQLSLF